MRFSERIGKKEVKTILQVESIDDELKTRLWNIIMEQFFDIISTHAYKGDTPKEAVCKFIWKEFFNKAVDRFPRNEFNGNLSTHSCISFIREWFFKCEWYEIYDFLEFILPIETNIGYKLGISINNALEKEVAGYRVINSKILQITSTQETEAIEEAINKTENWKSVNTHLQKALEFLSDRKTPDYRNSIKESISAVESTCKLITGDSNATLGKALTEIEQKYQLHAALKSSFSALYGYTSDASGIRHALLENSIPVSFPDAKFMLVSCSAFINYLKSKIKT